MPGLFFTWAQRDDKRVHYEFLDNSVPLGERPRTVAFGWNRAMNVLDVRRMIDVVRYRKLDINARSPEALYPDRFSVAAENCTDFLRQCVRDLELVNFADQASGRVYLRMRDGRAQWMDRDAVHAACADADTRAGLLAVAPHLFDGSIPGAAGPSLLQDLARAHDMPTLGRWGGSG